MTTEVTVSMPLQLTTDMMRAVRIHHTTSFADNEKWHTHLGWLICAYDVLLEARRAELSNASTECAEFIPGKPYPSLCLHCGEYESSHPASEKHA